MKLSLLLLAALLGHAAVAFADVRSHSSDDDDDDDNNNHRRGGGGAYSYRPSASPLDERVRNLEIVTDVHGRRIDELHDDVHELRRDAVARRDQVVVVEAETASLRSDLTRLSAGVDEVAEQVDGLLEKGRTVVISDDITEDTTLDAATVRINGEVHVRAGATLSLARGTTVEFRPFNPFGGATSMLIVDSGASIHAYECVFKSADRRPFNSGGVIILGTAVTQQFEDYDTIVSDSTAAPGQSALLGCVFAGLGSPVKDLNALTLIGVTASELTLTNTVIQDAGDDGLEIFGGDVTINGLTVDNSLDDAFDVDAGYTGIVRSAFFLRSGSSCHGLIEVTGGATVEFAEGTEFHLAGENISDKGAGGAVNLGEAGSVTFVADSAGCASGTTEDGSHIESL